MPTRRSQTTRQISPPPVAILQSYTWRPHCAENNAERESAEDSRTKFHLHLKLEWNYIPSVNFKKTFALEGFLTKFKYQDLFCRRAE
ncbi:unnamed protein product [Leptosia nina]|uniref:Uncharacterized protein n=1 Tax=Leptosia nina TaxID=320188 RepID=A0AAV1JQ94_9NEOP